MSVNDNGVALNTVVSPTVTDERLKAPACTCFFLLMRVSPAGSKKQVNTKQRYYNAGRRALIFEKEGR